MTGGTIAAEFSRELGAISLGARRVPRPDSHVRVVRQAAEIVPRAVRPGSDEHTEVR